MSDVLNVSGKEYAETQAYIARLEAENARLLAELAEARKDAARLRKGIDAVSALIAESHGVAGLHLNGDVASWDELLAGGRFEEWLADFDAARSHPVAQKATDAET